MKERGLASGAAGIHCAFLVYVNSRSQCPCWTVDGRAETRPR